MVILFSLQCKWKWEIVRILQPQKEISGARICLRKIAFGSGFPGPQSKWAHGRRSGRDSRAPNPSQPPRHSSEKRFPRNSAKSAGKSAAITEAKPAGPGWITAEG
jgi:hypothetical protein